MGPRAAEHCPGITEKTREMGLQGLNRAGAWGLPLGFSWNLPLLSLFSRAFSKQQAQ